MQIWFYVGDSLDWLKSHRTVSGVTRVTTELLFAALDQEHKQTADIVPCIFACEKGELVSVSPVETLFYFSCKASVSIPVETSVLPQVSLLKSPSALRQGDHVIFTGIVWTPFYTRLFSRLTANGINYSVLIHDIIPIERPDLIGHDNEKMFSEWLRTLVTNARLIFVSSHVTKDQILRWAAMMGIDVTARIVPILFGSSHLRRVPGDEYDCESIGDQVRDNFFVLTVGTIDRRKNQLFMCKVWTRLLRDLGESTVPQLVLAGRNDLKLDKIDADVARAIEQSQIIILEALSDCQLSALYRKCLFTIFPSLSEGYGLPVEESLSHGKLCLASNLPTIREHAGDLAWYFDAEEETSAYDLARRLVEEPELRSACEQRIQKLYRPLSWSSTFKSIVEAIKAATLEFDTRSGNSSTSSA